MTTNSLRPMAFRFALGSVLGAALLAGTAYGDARASSAAGAEADQLDASKEQATRRAEEAVAKSPADAGTRAALGQAYLRAGRFGSAAAAFTDAMALGDTDARTSLGLALANIAMGNNREALGILQAARGGISAADLGLAAALAGETSHGVAILSDALRGGENTPKVRQNLAYAYALDGRWAEARIMMTQDVPPEYINARLTQWAASGRPELYQYRVAVLVGAPMRSDPGLPTHLALSPAPAEVQAAEAAVPAYAPASVYAPAPTAELPAVEHAAAQPVPAEQAQAYAPAPMPAPLSGYSASTAGPLAASAPAAAPVASEDSLAAFAEFARPADSMVSAPAALASAPAPAPARVATPASARSAARTPAPRAQVQPVEGGNHVVQLGAFSSEANARRAWDQYVSRNPALKSARMVITPARVNGRNFWRVAAASYDRPAAQSLCSAVKANGGTCFAYAVNGPRQNLLMARTEIRSGGGGLALARR